MNLQNLIFRIFIAGILLTISLFLIKKSDEVDCHFVGFSPDGTKVIMSEKCWVRNLFTIVGVFCFCLSFYFLIGVVKINF